MSKTSDQQKPTIDTSSPEYLAGTFMRECVDVCQKRLLQQFEETGRIRDPSPAELEQLARDLERTLDGLVAGSGGNASDLAAVKKVLKDNISVIIQDIDFKMRTGANGVKTSDETSVLESSLENSAKEFNDVADKLRDSSRGKESWSEAAALFRKTEEEYSKNPMHIGKHKSATPLLDFLDEKSGRSTEGRLIGDFIEKSLEICMADAVQQRSKEGEISIDRKALKEKLEKFLDTQVENAAKFSSQERVDKTVAIANMLKSNLDAYVDQLGNKMDDSLKGLKKNSPHYEKVVESCIKGGTFDKVAAGLKEGEQEIYADTGWKKAADLFKEIGCGKIAAFCEKRNDQTKLQNLAKSSGINLVSVKEKSSVSSRLAAAVSHKKQPVLER